MRNLGEIGFSKYCVTECGKVYSLRVNRFLSGWTNVSGYTMYALTDDNGKVHRNVFGHRAIAQAFVDGYKEHLQVNHINGIKTDNSLKNLEWVTASENVAHANATGLRPPTFLTDLNKLPSEKEKVHDWTERRTTSHLVEEDIIEICKLLEDGYRVCDVSSMTGFDRRFCQKIRDKYHKKWEHITKDYTFDKISRKRKTSPEKVVEVCKMLEAGDKSINKISEETGLCRKTVSSIKSRRFHIDLSKNFKF